jgi:alkanesulfonate monooxygenase SsuD/methylene tetrahydromethanopterin reductase-like flavin-dependent oxidoreductase (luciferase family)
MKYGVFDHLDFGDGSLSDLYAMRLALIEKYDAAGFYGYHQAEHHGTKLGASPSPSVFLAAASQRSTTLRLGAMVFCLPLYQPLRLLEEICMLDQISKGRLDIGVGRGISPIEGAFFGINPEEGPAIYREYLELILQGLKGGELTFQGDVYSVTDMPMMLEPVQRPHPPLWVGLGQADATVWPAQNGINVISNVTATRMRAVTDRYRSEWAANGGAEDALPLLGLTRHLVIADDRDEAYAIARRAYEPWRAHFLYLWDRAGVKGTIVLPNDFDEFAADGRAIFGTPEDVAAQVFACIEESGINYFIARFAFGDISFSEAERSVDYFKESVLDR